MTPSEYIQNMRARIEALKANRTQEVKRIAEDLSALIKLRIQSDGEDYTGQPFAPYVPSYAKKRQDGGYQTSYVDFTVTGRLMANVQPYVLEETDSKTVVEITARNEEDQLKLRGARGKRGNILTPSNDELQMVADANRERIRKYLGI